MGDTPNQKVSRTTALYRRRRAAGLCEKCGEPAESGKSKCRKHLDADNNKKRARVAAGLCCCGGTPRPGFKTCSACSQRYIDYHHRLKIEALTHYSDGKMACACCQERIIQFLTIDHKEGGGKKHLEVIGQGKLYAWLAKNHYPPGFQVLCIQCNFGRQINGGVCPHVTARRGSGGPCVPAVSAG